jgi:prepilin-type N-terminal cleavage/methylation domain-containing protein
MIRHSQAGLTLVELLVAVVILTIVSGVLTQATIIGLRTTGNTAQRVSESADAQLVSNFFGTDIQSAEAIWLTPNSTCWTKTPLLRLNWVDRGTGDTHAVSYTYVSQSNGGERQLVRQHWVNPPACTAPIPVAADSQTLARSLDATPTVTCSGSEGACSPLPVTVSLTLSEHGGTFSPVLSASTRTGA